jgi:Carboxymuconolactone decarboxylase family
MRTLTKLSKIAAAPSPILIKNSSPKHAGATYGHGRDQIASSVASSTLACCLRLTIHIRGAINNELSEVEIREALLQVSSYCGVPVGVKVFKTAEKTIDEMTNDGQGRIQETLGDNE